MFGSLLTRQSPVAGLHPEEPTGRGRHPHRVGDKLAEHPHDLAVRRALEHGVRGTGGGADPDLRQRVGDQLRAAEAER
jgi:hypothetical protein